MNKLNKLTAQLLIDQAYLKCDAIKNQVATLQHEYNNTLARLESLSDQSGLCVSQSIVDICRWAN